VGRKLAFSGFWIMTGNMTSTSGRHVPVRQLPEKFSVKQGRIFFREIESCLQSDRPRVVLDFSKVRQIDSAGVQVLLRCLEEAMKRNGDVKLAAIPPEAAAMLRRTRVDRLFEAFDNTSDAVNSFHQFQAITSRQPFGHEYSIPTPAVQGNTSGEGWSNSRRTSGESALTAELTMKDSSHWLRRQIAGCLVVLMLTPFAFAAPSSQQEMNADQRTDLASAVEPKSQASDASAKQESIATSQAAETLPNSPGAVPPPASDNKLLASGQQASLKQQQDFTQEPEGTAVAQPVIATGVAASRPAGAAIAPAKQRRARSILIKVGVILGAGAAIGTVVALSSASPSHPH
jgi:anti-sigma B factor antagonist